MIYVLFLGGLLAFLGLSAYLNFKLYFDHPDWYKKPSFSRSWQLFFPARYHSLYVDYDPKFQQRKFYLQMLMPFTQAFTIATGLVMACQICLQSFGPNADTIRGWEDYLNQLHQFTFFNSLNRFDLLAVMSILLLLGFLPLAKRLSLLHKYQKGIFYFRRAYLVLALLSCFTFLGNQVNGKYLGKQQALAKAELLLAKQRAFLHYEAALDQDVDQISEVIAQELEKKLTKSINESLEAQQKLSDLKKEIADSPYEEELEQQILALFKDLVLPQQELNDFWANSATTFEKKYNDHLSLTYFGDDPDPSPEPSGPDKGQAINPNSLEEVPPVPMEEAIEQKQTQELYEDFKKDYAEKLADQQFDPLEQVGNDFSQNQQPKIVQSKLQKILFPITKRVVRLTFSELYTIAEPVVFSPDNPLALLVKEYVKSIGLQNWADKLHARVYQRINQSGQEQVENLAVDFKEEIEDIVVEDQALEDLLQKYEKDLAEKTRTMTKRTAKAKEVWGKLARASQEQSLWDLAEHHQLPQSYHDYLQEFPKGKYSKKAKQKISALNQELYHQALASNSVGQWKEIKNKLTHEPFLREVTQKILAADSPQSELELSAERHALEVLYNLGQTPLSRLLETYYPSTYPSLGSGGRRGNDFLNCTCR